MTGPVITQDLQIVNLKGLHARAASKFVRCAAQYSAKITVSKDGQSVDGTSIMGLLMLAAAKGSTISVAAIGAEAEAALEALAALVAGRFQEDE